MQGFANALAIIGFVAQTWSFPYRSCKKKVCDTQDRFAAAAANHNSLYLSISSFAERSQLFGKIETKF